MHTQKLEQMQVSSNFFFPIKKTIFLDQNMFFSLKTSPPKLSSLSTFQKDKIDKMHTC